MNVVRAETLRRPLEMVLDLLNFSITNLAVITVTIAMADGAKWVWVAIPLTFVAIVLGDELLSTHPKSLRAPKWYLDAQLWLALPLLFAVTLVALDVTAPIPIPFVDDLLTFLGFDTRQSNGQVNCWVVFFVVGFIYGGVGITVAHELCHRRDFLSQVTARWLLAFTWDTGFSIEHVYGHHKNVGTKHDPVTARRGESLWQYLSRSVLGQVRNAMLIEQNRILRTNQTIFQNKFYRGQLMSLTILILYISFLGWTKGLSMCLFAAAIGKLLLETSNYIEHYGLIRIPGRPIESRHSWDCYKRISCYSLYNLPVHADHHQFASRPFYDLSMTEKNSPIMPFGYMLMFVAAMFPPVWRKLIHPRLEAWDRHLASAEELRYLELIKQKEASSLKTVQ